MKRVVLKIFLLGSCAILMAMAASAQPRTEKMIEQEDTIGKVLPRITPGVGALLRGAEVLGAAEQNKQLQDLVAQGGTAAEIDARLQAADKSLFYDNRRGAPSDVVGKTFASDIETVATNFQECQDTEHPHTFEQVFSEPEITFSACSIKVNFPGMPSGVCMKCIPDPYFCGCFWILADLVDYHFPTFKLDASEQPYQSLYLDESVVESFATENDQQLRATGAAAAVRNIQIGQTATALTLAEKGIILPQSDIAVDPKVAELTDKMYDDVPSTLRTTVPDSSRVYTRNISEPLDLSTTNIWWIPHLPSVQFFASDAPPFLTLASRSLDITSLPMLASQDLIQRFFRFLAPGGAFSCVHANRRSGKSPSGIELLDLANLPSSMTQNDDLCLKNVGERFPLTDTRRTSITDRTFRGYAKDLDLWQAVVPPGTRHSFEEKKDRMLVLRNEKLKSESPGCKPLQDMTRRNVDYATANIKDIKSGGENTVEVFTGFRGCWGFKGIDENSGFWDAIVGPTPLRLQ